MMSWINFIWNRFDVRTFDSFIQLGWRPTWDTRHHEQKNQKYCMTSLHQIRYLIADVVKCIISIVANALCSMYCTVHCACMRLGVKWMNLHGADIHSFIQRTKIPFFTNLIMKYNISVSQRESFFLVALLHCNRFQLIYVFFSSARSKVNSKLLSTIERNHLSRTSSCVMCQNGEKCLVSRPSSDQMMKVNHIHLKLFSIETKK